MAVLLPASGRSGTQVSRRYRLQERADWIARMRADIGPLAFGLRQFPRMSHRCSRGIDKAGDGMALQAHGFDVAGSLGLREFAAGNGSGLLTIGVDRRESSRTGLNESSDVLGAPDACFAEFHWFRRVTIGDPGVP